MTEALPRGFESPYEAFVWKELSIIREMERDGDYYDALVFSVSLIKYLHPKVREKQEAKAQAMLEKVNRAIRTTVGVDWYMTQMVKNEVAERQGKVYLEQFVAELCNQLGERLYMERGAVSPRVTGSKKLEVRE